VVLLNSFNCQLVTIVIPESMFVSMKMNALLQIRYIGLSNETPYGLMKFIQVAEKYASHLKIVSLQVWLLTIVQILLYCFFIFVMEASPSILQSVGAKCIPDTNFLLFSDRIHIAFFVELLILQWLNAAIRRGILYYRLI